MYKKLFLKMLVFTLLIITSCKAQVAQNKTSSLRADGKSNNTFAFNNWSNNITGKKNVTLNLTPNGAYIVGAQYKNGNGTYIGKDIITIKNCENITINGNNATLSYKGGMRFGSFHPITGAKHVSNKKFTNRNYGAYIGNCIFIVNSKNVRVNDLNLKGNIDKQIIGGKWGDKGIQLNHTGIRIINSEDVRIRNCTTSYFGLDGFYLLNVTKQGMNTKHQKIRIENCLSEYNGRQGFSWTSGRGLYVKNSSFNHTGGSVVRSQPMSGLDIEPNKGSLCMDGIFENCSFVDNASSGFVTDHNGHKLLNNIIFNNCLFFASSGSAIFPKNGNLLIQNSRIYGSVVAPGGPSPSNRLVIKNCTFKDTSFSGEKSRYHPVLIDAGGKRKNFTIDGCKFYMNSMMPCYILSGSTINSELPIISNNKFYLRYKKAPRKFFALFKGCILENNIFYDQMSPNIKEGLYINSKTASAGYETMIYRGFNKIISTRNNIGWISPKGPKKMAPKQIGATR